MARPDSPMALSRMVFGFRLTQFIAVRPMSGLQALGDEMGRRVATVLPDWKAKG